MKNKTQSNTELLVDFTIHDVPVELITEFAATVVKPYYLGNLKATIKDLMEKAIAEQQFLQNHIATEAGTIKAAPTKPRHLK